jgi:hypothetical protein
MTTGLSSSIQRPIPSTIAGGTFPRPIAATTIPLPSDRDASRSLESAPAYA